MIDVIILRSVFGKVGQKYYIQPCPNPMTGRFADCVRTVDSNGDMILSEKDKEDSSRGVAHFIPVDHIFLIEDGHRLDLKNLYDKSIWEAIKFSNIIAKDRDERDPEGNLIIDGNQRRYGTAELYVERPGEITQRRVSKKQLVFKASQYIYEDSEQNRIKKCQVLGRDLRNAHAADVLDYMISIAEKEPNKIIGMYEDDNWKMHLFVLDAIERGVLKRINGVYTYDEDKLLGGSIEATITFLRDIRYKSLYDSIKRETYPEYWTQQEVDNASATQSKEINNLADNVEDEKATPEPKVVKKKK